MKTLLNNLAKKPLLLDLISLLAGGLLPFAFAPYNWYLLAVICPAILLATWLTGSPGRVLRRGFLFGLSFFAIAVYWVFISIHTFGNTPIIIAFIITAGFVALLAFCIGVSGLTWRWLFPQNNSLSLTLGFALLWVLVEWLRGWLFTGFPWVFLGYSQINSALAGLAPIVSVYGVSFCVALSSGLIVNSFYSRRRCIYSLSVLVFLWVVSFGLAQINWTHKTGKAVTVSLVQGNIAQTIKWNPDRIPTILSKYYELTLPNFKRNIIVWPEAAVPVWLSQATDFTKRIKAHLKPYHSVLLTGIPIVDAEQTHVYNAAIVLGNGKGHYLKRHLVPFGEYVPLESWLRGIIGFFNLPMSNLSAGPSRQHLINLAGIPTAVAICYEIAYDVEFMHSFPAAKLIVTISDDAWFGSSWASEQQTQISQMRSLETGRYQLVATNNGMTAIIGPKGQLLAQAPRFETAVLNGEIYNISGNTPIAKLGIAPIIVLLCIILIILLIFDKKLND